MTENERAQHSAAHRRRSRAVSAQYALFEKELPALLEAHAGEWVVYLDGPKHFAADQDSALRWACGLTWETPFVVAEVAPIVARPLSAAHAFQPVASVSTDEALRAQVAAARADRSRDASAEKSPSDASQRAGEVGGRPVAWITTRPLRAAPRARWRRGPPW